MEGVTKLEPFWEDPPPHLTHPSGSLGGMSQSPTHANTSNLHYERNLNFSTVAIEDSEYGFQKKKSARDPHSHRIIEKRRRDRMNNCLADLARLLPQASLRKGRGRIEKTEIVELAIKHLKHLQNHPCPLGENCEFSPMARNLEGYELHQSASSPQPIIPGETEGLTRRCSDDVEQYRLGYQECLQETVHFLLERKSISSGDALCAQLVDHLNRHAQSINDKVARAHPSHCQEVGLSDAESDSHTSKKNNDGSENDEEVYKIPLIGGYQRAERRPSTLTVLLNGLSPEQNHCQFDCDGDNNSCSSTPLSLDTSDVVSIDGKKHCGPNVKPPLPSIIVGSHLPSSNSALTNCSSGRSSDERSDCTSVPNCRYKFKSTIKQRFTADLETAPETTGKKDGLSKDACRYRSAFVATQKNDERASPSGDLRLSDDHDESGTGSPSLDEKPDLEQLSRNVNFSTGESTSNEKWSHKFGIYNGKQSIPASGEMKEKSEQLIEKVKKSSPRCPYAKDESRNGVPAFALHDSGLFYFPLTLERDFVAPYSVVPDPAGPNPPLHPITISVCFLWKDPGSMISTNPIGSKFCEPHAQRDLEALNLCKSYIRSTHHVPQVSETLRISQSPFPSLFPTRFNQPAHGQRLCSGNMDPEPHSFSPFESQQRRLIPPTEMFNQNRCSDSNFLSIDLPRESRKRHFGNSSQSSDSISSMSLGCHSWIDSAQSAVPLESTANEPSEPILDLFKGDKSERSKTCTRQSPVKSQRNGLNTSPKRARKGNASPRNVEVNGF